MTIDDAVRLVALLRQFRKSARQLDSLARRICALLRASGASEDALSETTLNAMEGAAANTMLLLSERILRAREATNNNNDERDKEPRNGDD